MSQRCWSAALLISYRPLFRQGDHQLYMVDSLHQWISSRLTCSQKTSKSFKINMHHVSSCVAYLLTLDGLESCLFWPNDEIQTSSARQTPPILSFSGYLTDDELGALDAADPRKALSEFGQLKLSEYRLSLQEVVAGTGSRVGNGANSERLEQTERQWCLDRYFTPHKPSAASDPRIFR